MTYEWNAGDISNIITISSAALASVLMVLFRLPAQVLGKQHTRAVTVGVVKDPKGTYYI